VCWGLGRKREAQRSAKKRREAQRLRAELYNEDLEDGAALEGQLVGLRGGKVVQGPRFHFAAVVVRLTVK
jgi:hypothetical protein